MINDPSLAQLAEATVLSSVKSEFESLRRDHPIYKAPVWRIYGPYKSKADERLRVVAYDGDRRITISYPRFMIECLHKRVLDINDDVHHADNDVSNNLIRNFEILNSLEHKQGHTKYEDYQELNCVRCNRKVILSRKQIYYLVRNMTAKKSSGVHCKECWDKA